jgi:hypothetical protein
MMDNGGDGGGGGGGLEISDLWDPNYKDQVGDQDAAEKAYLHFLRDPTYFAALYANPAAWSNSAEVANLDVFFQYSSLHTTAKDAVSSGFDPDVAANLDLAHTYYGLGDLDLTNQCLAAAIMVGTPGGALVSIPDTWLARIADNGMGIVFQQPGALGNANMVRIMEPGANPNYPLGYVRYYNAYGQPVNPLTGRPGLPSETHIPINYLGPLYNWPK